MLFRSEIGVVRVVRVGHQVIGGIVPCAIVVSGIGHEGKAHAYGRRVVEADEGILDHAVEVVRQVHSEALARRERCGQPVVLVVAHELGLRIGVRLLQDVDGSAQGRPGARGVGRLEAILDDCPKWELSNLRAGNAETERRKKGRTCKSSPETCTSE